MIKTDKETVPVLIGLWVLFYTICLVCFMLVDLFQIVPLTHPMSVCCSPNPPNEFLQDSHIYSSMKKLHNFT